MDFNDYQMVFGLSNSIDKIFKFMEEEFLKKMKNCNLQYTCYKCLHQEVCSWWKQAQEVANQLNYIIEENIEETPEIPHPLMFTLDMKCVYFDEVED